NLRNKLAEHEQQLARQEGSPVPFAVPAHTDGADRNVCPTAAPPATPVPAEYTDAEQAQRLARLEVLAGDLADQRLRLAHQRDRFLLTQQTWHAEHASFFPQLEEAARRL